VQAVAAGKWKAGLYDAKHAFVWEKAKGAVELLAAKSGERILDLGCGTGTLTAEIAACGAHVVGVDRSAEMIDEARKKFPAIEFEVCEARALPFFAEFDAVFSRLKAYRTRSKQEEDSSRSLAAKEMFAMSWRRSKTL
jgi:trans-aconitate methyltransferase